MFFYKYYLLFSCNKLLIDLINFDVAGSVDAFCELYSWFIQLLSPSVFLIVGAICPAANFTQSVFFKI